MGRRVAYYTQLSPEVEACAEKVSEDLENGNYNDTIVEAMIKKGMYGMDEFIDAFLYDDDINLAERPRDLIAVLYNTNIGKKIIGTFLATGQFTKEELLNGHEDFLAEFFGMIDNMPDFVWQLYRSLEHWLGGIYGSNRAQRVMAEVLLNTITGKHVADQTIYLRCFDRFSQLGV